MSLSPSHADRVRIPEQPRPPEHEPTECGLEPCATCYGEGQGEQRTPTDRGTLIETVDCDRCNGTGTIYACPTCDRIYTREDFPDADWLECHGDGVCVIREEPRE